MDDLIEKIAQNCCYGVTFGGSHRPDSPTRTYDEEPAKNTNEKTPTTTAALAEDRTHCSEQTASDDEIGFSLTRRGPSPIIECSTMEELGSVSTRNQSYRSYKAPQPLDEGDSVDMSEIRGSYTIESARIGDKGSQDLSDTGNLTHQQEPPVVRKPTEPSLSQHRDNFLQTSSDIYKFPLDGVSEQFVASKELFAGLELSNSASTSETESDE